MTVASLTHFFLEAMQFKMQGKCGTANSCDLTGLDYYGNDITSFSIESAAACACRCRLYGNECQAWAFAPSYSYCWLKTRASQPLVNKDRISGSKECKCITDKKQCSERGVRYTGTVLRTINISTATGCSCACSRENGCLVWTFISKRRRRGEVGRSGICTLMSRATKREQSRRYILSESAILNCQSG